MRDRDSKKREDELLDEIRRSAQQMEVPESLRPEHIEEMLKKTEKEGGFIKEGSRQEECVHAKEDKKIPWKRYAVRLVEMAAVLSLTFMAGYQAREIHIQKVSESGAGVNAISNLQTDSGMQTAEAAQPKRDVKEAEEAQPKRAEDTEKETQTKTKADSKAAEAVRIENGAPEQEIEGLTTASDKTGLFRKLKEVMDARGIASLARGGLVKEGAMLDMAVEYESAPMAGNSIGNAMETGVGGDFSKTNVREAGVDEGDIVKTDGEYLYILKHNSSIRIVKLNGTKMELTAAIHLEELSESVADMYLDKDRLIVITSGTKSRMEEAADDVYAVKNETYVKAVTYDISDRTNPTISGTIQQEGYYKGSRKRGDYLYLFTEFCPVLEKEERGSDIMPLVNGEELEPKKIYVPDYMEDTSYLVMGSVDIREPEQMIDSKAVISGAQNFYVSNSSIYIYNQEWEEGKTSTHLLKFGFENGYIKGEAAGVVNGSINNSFSIDEYEGYLRLVTTDWSSQNEINRLFVLDEKLEIVGHIDDIAPGESIRSARFLGKTGYFVTFKQMDPLFSVDLSDPRNPEIVGELKITGFSSYLHFYGEDKLLGIGYEADPENGVTTGIKLSMFDISNPHDVKELKKYVIKDASYCPGMDQYKAIMIDPEKNLVGFACDEEYLVFSYDAEEGFKNEMTYHLDNGAPNYWYGNDTCRGVYAGDVFYLADSDKIFSFDMKEGFELVEKLELT